MYSREFAFNLIKIGHLKKCRIQTMPQHVKAYQIDLIAQDGQGGGEELLEDERGRPAAFLSVSEARRVAVSLGLAEDNIELPKC